MEDGSIWIRLGIDEAGFKAKLEEAKGTVKSFGESVSSTGKTLEDLLKVPEKELGKYGEQIAALGGDIAKAMSSITPLADEVNDTIIRLQEEYRKLGHEAGEAFMSGDDDRYRNLKALQDELSGIMDVYGKLHGAIGESTDRLAQQAEAVESLADKSAAMRELESAVGKADGSVNSLLNSVRGISGVFRGTTNPIQAFRALITAAKSTLNLAKISADALKTSLKALSRSFAPLLVISAVVAVFALLKKKFDEHKKAAEEAAKAQEEFNKSVAENAARPIAAFMRLREQWNALGNDLKSRQKFITDNRKEFNNLGVAVNSVADAERLFTQQADAFVEAQMKKAMAAAYFSQAEKDAAELIEAQQKRDEAKKKLEKTPLTRTVEHSHINARTGTVTSWTTKESNQKAIDEAQKEYDAANAKVGEINARFQQNIKKSVDENAEALSSMVSAGIKSTTDNTISAIEQQQKRLSEAYAKALDDFNKNKAKAEQKARFDARQVTVDGMADGLEKTLAQLRLNHDREMAQIEEQENEKIEQWRKLKEKEWAARNPQADTEKNPWRKKAMYDENGAFRIGSLSEDDAADLSNALAVFTTMRENENAKWKKNEADALADILGEDESYFARRRAMEERYLRDRAALVEKGATADQLALFDSKYEAEQKELFADLLGDYVGFQQQLTEAAEEYNARRAELEAAANAETDPKKKAALQASLNELEKQYKQTVKSLQQEFIKNNIGDVFNEQTVENIKEAKRALDEMEGMSVDDFNLAYQANLSAEEFESLKKRIREVRNKLREMGKGYSLKDAFSDAFTGKTKDEVQRGVDYIVSGFSKVASVASGIASAMREFAEATGNAKLEQMADTFDSIADTISTAEGYAAAGAQIGGGWGAVIGAVLGIGQGVITAIFKSEAQKEEAERVRTEEAHDYLQEVISGIGSLIGSVNSLEDTVAGLDYSNYRKSLLDAINSLRSDVKFDSEANWNALRNGADAKSAFNMLDARHLAEVFDHMGGTVQGHVQWGSAWTGEGEDYEKWLRAMELYTKALEEGTLSAEELEEFKAIIRGMSGYGGAANAQGVRNAYANQQNHADYELDLRRKALLEELNRLYKEGSLNSMDYFNLIMKSDRLSLDMLRQERDKLIGEGYALDSKEVLEIENQIDELEYNMGERVRKMFEGLAGTDLQSIVNKWLDIFKEFGDNFEGAIDKINESIDDMIRNMIMQTAFVQPLLTRLKAYMNNYARDNELEQDEEGNYIWTNDAFRGMAEGLRGFIDGAKEDFIGLRDTLNTLGLGWGDSANDRSAQARGIATASQESVDELNGRMTAVQGHTFNISENSNIIRDNTNAILGSVWQIESYTQHLVRIDDDLHMLHSSLDSIININGIKIRN